MGEHEIRQRLNNNFGRPPWDSQIQQTVWEAQDSYKFIIETMTMDIGQAQEQGVAGPPPLDAPRFLCIDPPGGSIHHVELYCPENLCVDKDNTFIWVANDLGKVGDYSYILFGAYLFFGRKRYPLAVANFQIWLLFAMTQCWIQAF